MNLVSPNPRQSARRLAALLLCAAAGLAAQPHFAADATPEERRAFDVALKAFQDGVLGYARAEREFGDFVKSFPASHRHSEAVLRQAQSRYHMTNAAGAAELLTANLAEAGKFADEYQFWLGEALFLGGKFAPAAEAYAKLVATFPSSTNLLAASYNEALCRSKLGELRRVVDLLQPAASAFQRAAKARPRDEWVARGGLLLASTLLDLKDPKAGEAALNFPESLKLTPDLAWRRQYLVCRLQSADHRDELALGNTTALLSLASAAKNPRYSAESVALRGSLLAKLKRYDEAIAVYSVNLTTNAPPEFRRQALLTNIELTFAQNKVADTIRMLEEFSAQQPNDPALDVAQVTLGELRLKDYFTHLDASTNAPPPAATSLLHLALTNSARVITGFTNSPLLGRAHYTRGWALWNLGDPASSLADFRHAAERLPKSEEQAIARYKLGEAQMLLRDFTNAITNFGRVIDQFADLPRVQSTLFDQALYKMLRAAIAVGDLRAATEATRKILLWYPESYFSDRSQLLLGQAMNLQGRPEDARAVFTNLLAHFPQSPLAADVHRAVARTFQQEGNWSAAAAELNRWVARFPSNAALPDVEYERAVLLDRSLATTNAFRLFTNFVARFPAHSNAPSAQFWVATHHYNEGEFAAAEANYQRVFQNTNWQQGLLPFEARFAAGRCAYFRGEFKQATNYFLAIINMVNDGACPVEFKPRAYFALGDTYFEARFKESDPIGDAINAFTAITNNFPTNAIAPLAAARIGDMHYVRAGTALDGAAHYQNATNAYLKAMTWPGADLIARSNAEIGLARALDKLKRTADAVNHLLNVVYGKNLRDGEQPDPGAMKTAGFEAARLLEETQSWAEALRLYQRLLELFPPLRATLEKKAEHARKMLDASGKQ